MRLPRQALVSAAPIVVALVLSGVISFSYNRLLKEYRDAVDHTFTVLAAIDAVLINLQDAETGQRGFIITGNDSYLGPFTAARGKIPAALVHLRALVSDNPDHRPLLDRLQRLTDDKLAELDATISIRSRAGFDAAREAVMQNLGKQTMDAIRAASDEIRATERGLFDQRVAAARRAERLMIGVALICVLLSLIGRLLASILARRNVQQGSRRPTDI